MTSFLIGGCGPSSVITTSLSSAVLLAVHVCVALCRVRREKYYQVVWIFVNIANGHDARFFI